MIIYIRHASDQYDDPTFLHDQKIVKNKENIENTLDVAKFLIKEYGQPEVVICSPFERAKGTLNIMRKVFEKNVEIRYDTRVGRYFTSNEKKVADVRPTTLELKPSIYESWSKFKLRVQDHINTLIEDATLKSRHKVVWVVTHTLVIKEVAKYLKIETPDYFEFLLWMAIRSHGPEYSVSYVAVGNGPGNVEIIQKDVNREKSRIKREKTLRGDASDDDDKPRKKGKGKKKDDDDSLDSEESSDDLFYDICDPEEERRKIEMEKERERELEKERKRKAKEKEKYEKKAREKQAKHGNKKPEVVRPTTMDDHIKRQISIKKEQEQHQRRLFGAGIDGHVNDERRIQYKTEKNSVQKKQEMAKGTNIDDFARILFK